MQKIRGTSPVTYTSEDGGYLNEPAFPVAYIEYYEQNYWVIDLTNGQTHDGGRLLLCVKEETLQEV